MKLSKTSREVSEIIPLLFLNKKRKYYQPAWNRGRSMCGDLFPTSQSIPSILHDKLRTKRLVENGRNPSLSLSFLFLHTNINECQPIC